jgi:hypothetical protein
MFNGGKSDVLTVLAKSQARIVIPTRDKAWRYSNHGIENALREQLLDCCGYSCLRALN